MKNATIQSLLATNATQIAMYHDLITTFVNDAKFWTARGEKAYAVEEYKFADKNRIKLAKLVKVQHELKDAMAENNTEIRIRAKGVRCFGVEQEAILSQPLLTTAEVESALDELIEMKFPKKADSRPADHYSFQSGK